MALHSVVDLPAWTSRRQASRSELQAAWEKTLPVLGFERLFTNRYVSLENHILHEGAHLASKTHPVKKPIVSSQEKLFQWWRHPGGVICTVDKFSIDGGQTWLFNGIRVFAHVDNGFNPRALHSMDAPNGASIRSVTADVASPGFTVVWEFLRDAGREGRLLPLALWDSLGSCGDLLLHQAFTGKVGRLGRKDVETPAGRYRCALLIRARNLDTLSRPWLETIAASPLPDIEKQMWVRQLALEVYKASSPPGFPGRAKVPSWARRHLAMAPVVTSRQEHNHALIAARLRETLVECPSGPVDDLSRAGREVTARWLSVMEDNRHPRHMEPALRHAMETRLVERNLAFHEVLFNAADVTPRGFAKLAWWQSRQSPETLARLCTQPDALGMTLPMHWMRVWLETYNRRVFPREERVRHEACRRGLEALAKVVPCEKWVLSTDRHSMWDPVLGHQINLPMDDDLIEAHGRSLRGLLAWMDTTPLSAPSTVVVAPGLKVELLDGPDLPSILVAPHFERLGSGEHRAALLAPVVAWLHGALLAKALPVASRARQPRL